MLTFYKAESFLWNKSCIIIRTFLNRFVNRAMFTILIQSDRTRSPQEANLHGKLINGAAIIKTSHNSLDNCSFTACLQIAHLSLHNWPLSQCHPSKNTTTYKMCLLLTDLMLSCMVSWLPAKIYNLCPSTRSLGNKAVI